MRISSGTRAFSVFKVFGIQGVITKYRECLSKKIIFRNGITRLEDEHFLQYLIHLGEVCVYITLPGTFPSWGNTTSTFLPLQQCGSLGSCNVFLALISTTTSKSGYQTQTRLFKVLPWHFWIWVQREPEPIPRVAEYQDNETQEQSKACSLLCGRRSAVMIVTLIQRQVGIARRHMA